MESNNEEIKNPQIPPFIDQVLKFNTKENRTIIGKLKAYNKNGDFYLVECVEVFDKTSPHYAFNELFVNNNTDIFYYETEKYVYQKMNNCIFPLSEIGDIFVLKDEICNKYNLLLEEYDKKKYEKQLEEEKLKEEEKNKEIENNNNNNNETESTNCEVNKDEKFHKKEENKKRKKRKKKK